MQSDKYSMAEKILRDVESVINRDELLEEFMIIPVTLNENKSPVIHVEHNLGLESWCIKHVYSYAYQRILEVRKLVAKRKLLHDEYSNLNRLVIGCLLINSDVSTFWNIRRDLVSDNIISIPSELHFTKLVLSHKSKSNEAFGYRKWLLRKIMNSNLNKSNLCLVINDEFQVCNMTAQKSQNNYHSWCHRIWCIENLLFLQHCDELRVNVLTAELNYTELWVSKHVSEHTGFHYRQYILTKIKDVDFDLTEKYLSNFKQFVCNVDYSSPFDCLIDLFGPNCAKLLNDVNLHLLCRNLAVLLYDLRLNNDLNDTFSEHETLWCHRRYILYEIVQLLHFYTGLNTNMSTNNLRNLDLVFANDKRECNVVDNMLVSIDLCHKMKETGEKCPKILKCENNIAHASKLYRIIVENERSFIGKCSKLNNRQEYLAQRHEKWLSYILGLPIL